ncbi:MAG: hypothetical protein AB2L14_27805 [Candidatus Xenobiia bacterium LiM19]
MMSRKILMVLILVVFMGSGSLSPLVCTNVAIAGTDKGADTEEEPYVIEPCVFKVPVILPPSLQSQRKKLEESVMEAQRIVREFARENNWESLMKDSLFDRVEIYDDKEEYDRRIIYLTGEEPSTKIPVTYCAALERRVLITVSPELFMKVNPKFVEEGFFEMVMAHEITHRLHVRIVADENAMGPIWFFEGFAIYGSGQQKKDMPVLSNEEIWTIVREEKRGDYRKYNVVFRYFLQRIPLKKLVRMAAGRDFIDKLERDEKERGGAGVRDLQAERKISIE